MDDNNSINRFLKLLEFVNLKFYSLKFTKRFFQRKKFYLDNISLEDSINEKPESLYWSFNNSLFGEYCRETLKQLDEVIWLYENHISSDSYQFNTESIILRLKKYKEMIK